MKPIDTPVPSDIVIQTGYAYVYEEDIVAAVSSFVAALRNFLPVATAWDSVLGCVIEKHISILEDGFHLNRTEFLGGFADSVFVSIAKGIREFQAYYKAEQEEADEAIMAALSLFLLCNKRIARCSCGSVAYRRTNRCGSSGCR
jgi:hypothetical protein